MSGAGGPPLEGRVLGGHYLVGERLGAGAMGVVHRVRHTLLGREFAAKVIAPGLAGDPEARRRFLREAEGLARITHPNVVPVRHFGEEDGLLYLVMDLFEGESLRDLLAREGPLEERRAVRIAIQVLQALDAAHWEGVVHRDLKPANVLVGPGDAARGEAETVRVVDFGLARVAGAPALPGAASSAPGAVAGTVAYMSPEQVRGDADLDARSDLFSLGAVLHEALGGRPPFEGTSTLTVALQILERPPAPLPEEGPRGVSAPVRAVIARALEKDRDRRFRTAGDMADALRAALSGVAPAAAADAPSPRRRGGATAAAAAIAALAFGAWVLDRTMRPAPAGPGPVAAAPYDAARAAADRDLATRSLLDARFEAAVAAAERIHAAGLATPEDHLLLGRARAGAGDRSALETLVRAEDLLGKDPRPAIERARFRLDAEEDLDGAREELERVLASAPSADAGWEMVRVEAREALGLLGGPKEPGAGTSALMSLERAADFVGDDPRRSLAGVYETWARDDLELALVKAEDAAAALPDLAEASYLAAAISLALGTRERSPADAEVARRRCEKALLAAAEAVARARRRPELHLQGRETLRYWRTSCTVKYALGDVEGAAADYRNEVLSRNPGSRADLGIAAQYLQWAGRFEEALRLYEAARAAGAGDGYLHGEGFCRMQTGRMRAGAGDLAGALRDLDAAIANFGAGMERHPDTPAFLSYRAEALLARARLTRDDAAADALARAKADIDALEAAATAKDPEVLFRRWEHREATGDRAGALADIRAAIAAQRGATPSYHRRLAFSCIANAAPGPDGAALLEEAVRAADASEKWSPRRAELSCLLRGDARAALAARAAAPAERDRLAALAREDYARAATLARDDPRVRAEALLRAAGLALASGDAKGAVRDASEAVRLRTDAGASRGSPLLVDDDYLRSPLAAFHARLAEAFAADNRPADAERESARAKALR